MAPCDAPDEEEDAPHNLVQDEGEIRSEWETRRSRFYNVRHYS